MTRFKRPDGPITLDVFLRFLEYEPNSGCWLWSRTVSADGYGNIGATDPVCGRRVNKKAHRVSWELHKGAVPAGLLVLHRCDTPPCCNPDHLWLGTDLDNALDKIAKGRAGVLMGEHSNLARLNADQVREIRAMAAISSLRELAAAFGVGVENVRAIVKRQSWKHLP